MKFNLDEFKVTAASCEARWMRKIIKKAVKNNPDYSLLAIRSEVADLIKASDIKAISQLLCFSAGNKHLNCFYDILGAMLKMCTDKDIKAQIIKNKRREYIPEIDKVIQEEVLYLLRDNYFAKEAEICRLITSNQMDVIQNELNKCKRR